MATNNSHNDSNLNSVDLSLHEFFGAPWKSSHQSKSNQVALEMLLTPNDNVLSPRDPRGEIAIEEKPFVRRRWNKNKKISVVKGNARAYSIQQHQYVRALKLAYPSVWYIIRASQATTGAGVQRLQHTSGLFYKVIYLLVDFVWLILTPLQRALDVLFGDEYERAKRAVRSRVHRNRLWLGRSRGYTYLAAFSNRCRYMASYFHIHRFHQIDLFLRNNFTIRRGIQAILPAGLFYSVVQKAILAPTIVHSRGLEETAKKMYTMPVESLEQLFVLDEISIVDFDTEFIRLESGIRHSRETYLINEFVGGKYTDVEKTAIRNVVHPGEFMHMGIDKPANVDMYILPMANIGTYEIDLVEAEQIPDPEPVGPDEEEKDEETKLAEAAAIRASFIPISRYLVLREKDANMVKNHRTTERIRQYDNQCKKRLAYERKPNPKTYVEPVPSIQPELIEKEELKTGAKHRKAKKWLKELPLYDTVADNIPWRNELFRLVKFGEAFLQGEKRIEWERVIEKHFMKSNPRVALSPFGLTYEDYQSTPHTLTPFSTKENKILPYGFRDSRDMLKGFYLSYFQDQLNEMIAYTFALYKEPEEFVQVISDFSFMEHTDNKDDGSIEQDTLEDDADDESADDEDADDYGDKEENENDIDERNNKGHYEKTGNVHLQDISGMNDSDLDLGDKLGYNTALIVQHGEDIELIDDEPDKYSRIWFYLGTLFINPVNYEPWQYMAWKGLALQLIMYGGIECCIRLECRGVRIRLVPLPYVHRLIPHLGRMPEGVSARAYIGEAMNTVQVRKLLLAFQAKRGTELYGQSQWNKVWNLVIRPNISAKQALWLSIITRKVTNKLLQRWVQETEGNKPCIVIARNVSQYAGLPKRLAMDISPRYFGFDKVTQAIDKYTGTKNSAEMPLPLQPSVLAERQHIFNNLGGEKALARVLDYGKTVQEEICHFPLLALIKPGTHRMHSLPKGMILLGDPGNGRTYFVRTLATESRLPLLITESNRYLDQVLGLVRLKTLFKRARAQAPNILFIRDMDFMTRHRERYPMFTSVRATTQLLMAIDGYSHGTETIPSEQDIFVIGSMTTTLMMDEACMRSGRFEWLLSFYYPPINERHDMLILHSTKSIVNTSIDVDWNYFTAMTDGFSCLDIRTLVNTSAIYALKRNLTLHTGESVAFALGKVNHIHDLPEVTFSSTHTRSFFLSTEYNQRHANMTQYAPFFTQTGHVPMYKKLMHFFQAMIESETEKLSKRWHLPQPETGIEVELEPDRTLVNGLLPLFCEGLFLYNTQKTCSAPYPIIAFDTYCSPLFVEMKQMVDVVNLKHTLERITKENLFITTFDLWRRAHPHDWTPTALFNSKSIIMRVNTTTMWRSTRLAKKHSIIGGLTELEGEIIWGPPPLATKIKNRIIFVGEHTPEFVSRDATLFGTFETHSDLAFKCRKVSTARRIKQVSMEILDVMQKQWH